MAKSKKKASPDDIVQMNVSLRREQREYMEGIAEAEDRSVSSAVRLAIEALRRERGDAKTNKQD